MLERILDAVPDPPGELIRHDQHFKDLGLDPDRFTTRPAVVDLLLEHPKLMQRPIVFRGDDAIIGRPAEKVEALFG